MTPKEIKAARTSLCLSVRAFAPAIGYHGAEGGRVVMAMEAGTRHNKPFAISGPAAAAVGYLEAINRFIRANDSGEDLSSAVAELRTVLPEAIR